MSTHARLMWQRDQLNDSMYGEEYQNSKRTRHDPRPTARPADNQHENATD